MGLAETRGVQAASGNAMCCIYQRVRDLRVVFLLDWTGHTRFEHENRSSNKGWSRVSRLSASPSPSLLRLTPLAVLWPSPRTGWLVALLLVYPRPLLPPLVSTCACTRSRCTPCIGQRAVRRELRKWM